MHHHRVWKLAAVLLVGGCLSGMYLTSSATWTGSSARADWYGMSVTGRFRGDTDRSYDIAVGAPAQDRVFVYLDPLSSSPGGPYTFVGASGGEAGWSLAAGDLMGTRGLPELVIGAPSEQSGRGRVYLMEGGTITSNQNAASAAITLTGDAANEYAGYAVTVGDFNGDGDSDLLVGACGRSTYSGRVYRVDGPLAAGSYNLATAASFIVDGVATQEALGCALAASDLDGDGADEMIISQHWGNLGAGQVHVIDGSVTGSHLITSLPSGTLQTINGASTRDKLGHAIAGGADFDGDGLEDLLIGAPTEYCGNPTSAPCPPAAGKAYLVLGASPFVGGPINSVAEVEFKGTSAGDRLGHSVTFVDDMNGDVYAEAVVGAIASDRTHVWYGRPSPAVNLGSPLASAADAIIDGTAKGLFSGSSLADAGDLDGDRNPDLLIGARAVEWPYYTAAGIGEAYIFTGSELVTP